MKVSTALPYFSACMLEAESKNDSVFLIDLIKENLFQKPSLLCVVILRVSIF